MSIVVSVQKQIAQLRARAMQARTTAEESKAVSDIAFVVMAEAGTIDEVTASEHAGAFLEWQPGVYAEAGAYRSHESEGVRKLYRCLQAHTTQDGWQPDAAPSLWKVAGDPTVEWPQWSQPIGAVDAYDAGAKVSHNGKRWISDIGNNVWEPGVYGWTEVK